MLEKVQANLQAVNLSVNSLYVPDFVSRSYLNYGAAVSEASSLTNNATLCIYNCITIFK